MLLALIACAPIVGPLTATLYPLRVVCQEAHLTFVSGREAKCVLRIFNDTRTAEPIDMEWSLRSGGKAYAEGAETFNLAPGTSQSYLLKLHVPPFAEQAQGALVLTCLRGGQQVFRVVKKCVIAPSSRRSP